MVSAIERSHCTHTRISSFQLVHVPFVATLTNTVVLPTDIKISLQHCRCEIILCKSTVYRRLNGTKKTFTPSPTCQATRTDAHSSPLPPQHTHTTCTSYIHVLHTRTYVPNKNKNQLVSLIITKQTWLLMFLPGKKPTGLLHTYHQRQRTSSVRTTRDKELPQYSTTQSHSNKLGTTELEILTTTILC